MKYSIKETGETVSPYKLYRYDEYAGVPNNAELEFWARIKELENAIKTFLTKTQLGKNQSTWTTEDWNHRQAQKLLEVLNK